MSWARKIILSNFVYDINHHGCGKNLKPILMVILLVTNECPGLHKLANLNNK